MATAERRAEVVWEGNLARGTSNFTVGSGAMGEQAVTWASRTERSDGKTSPEELIAVAHASCFAMALSNVLDEGGTPPERLQIEAVCTFDVENGKVSSVDLDIRGRVAVAVIDSPPEPVGCTYRYGWLGSRRGVQPQARRGYGIAATGGAARPGAHRPDRP